MRQPGLPSIREVLADVEAVLRAPKAPSRGGTAE